MASLFGLQQCDMVANLIGRWHAPRRNERVIARMNHEGGDAYGFQVGLCGGASPVVVCAFESVKWRREKVVKFVDVLDS